MLESLIKKTARIILEGFDSKNYFEFCKSIGLMELRMTILFQRVVLIMPYLKPEKFKVRNIKVYHIDEVNLKTVPKIS